MREGMRIRSDPTSAMLNRERERPELDGLLGELRSGRGRALVVLGEAGVAGDGFARGHRTGVRQDVRPGWHVRLEDHRTGPRLHARQHQRLAGCDRLGTALTPWLPRSTATHGQPNYPAK